MEILSRISGKIIDHADKEKETIHSSHLLDELEVLLAKLIDPSPETEPENKELWERVLDLGREGNRVADGDLKMTDLIAAPDSLELNGTDNKTSNDLNDFNQIPDVNSDL